jgi:hypothetical protein
MCPVFVLALEQPSASFFDALYGGGFDMGDGGLGDGALLSAPAASAQAEREREERAKAEAELAAEAQKVEAARLEAERIEREAAEAAAAIVAAAAAAAAAERERDEAAAELRDLPAMALTAYGLPALVESKLAAHTKAGKSLKTFKFATDAVKQIAISAVDQHIDALAAAEARATAAGVEEASMEELVGASRRKAEELEAVKAALTGR